VGRLGRTEFAIIAPATEAEGAQRLAERVRAAVDAARISITGGGGRMSDSGVAQDAVESADTAEEGLRHLGVRIGYYAVPDFAESAVDAVEMVVRAADALRQSLTSGVMASPIQAFVEPIAASLR
jgi:GGDEF domain-containing protein